MASGLNITIPVLGFPSAVLALLSRKETDQTIANEIIHHALEDLFISIFDAEYDNGVIQCHFGPGLGQYSIMYF